MIKRTSLIFALSPLLTGAFLLLALNVLDPITTGPAGVLVVFSLIYAFWLSLLFVLLHFGISLVGKMLKKQNNKLGTKHLQLGAKKAYYLASVIAFVPVVLLAMRSFAQLRSMDVLLVVLLTAVASFFVLKRQQ